MTVSSKFVGLSLTVLAAGACAGDDPCDVPGTACVWAGVGERGFNIEDPDAHRLHSKLYYPEDLTFYRHGEKLGRPYPAPSPFHCNEDESIAWRNGKTGNVAVDPFHRIRGSKRQCAGEHFVKGDPERIEITASVD